MADLSTYDMFAFLKKIDMLTAQPLTYDMCLFQSNSLLQQGWHSPVQEYCTRLLFKVPPGLTKHSALLYHIYYQSKHVIC